MRILHIIGGGDVGGAKMAVISLLSRITRTYGTTGEAVVRLISLREGDFADTAREAGIDTVVIPTRGAALEKGRVLRAARDFRPDLLHCHGARANLIGVLLKNRLGVPVISTMHSDYRLDYLGSPLRHLSFGSINSLALRRVDYFTCVSDRMARTMIARGFNPERCFVVYNGIDYTPAADRPDRAAYWQTYGYHWKPGDVVCVLAARLTAVKDVPTLLYAAAKAMERVPALHLVIGGDGEDRNALEALARELNIAARVTFAGWVKDTRTFFAAADINVLCSISETFPYSVTEGIREGCATIVTDVGGMPELIRSGYDGFIVQPRDRDTLADRLAALAGDETLRRTFSERLYRRASERFSLDRMAADQVDIYRTVLRRCSRPYTRDGVVICGAYGKGNAGDDAILEAIVREMRSIDPDMPVRVLSRSPGETRLKYRVSSTFTFNLPGVVRAFSKARLYINGGGSLIQDITSSRSLWFYLWTLSQARRQEMRVMMYGCGIGPLLREANKKRAARVLNRSVDVITLREDDSARELARMGVTCPKIIAAADPALTILPNEEGLVHAMEEQGLSMTGKYLAVCVRPWKGFHADVFADAARYAYERYGWETVLLPVELPRDLEACEAVARLLTVPHRTIRERYPADVTIGLLTKMRGAMAMRLHALIFAASAGVPLAGIAYDPKVIGFMRYMRQENVCALSEATAERLCGFIDAMAATEQAAVAANTERLRELERRNRDAAAELLR